eukprot:jgi/Chrzof1/14642/Cz09g10150.t1
MCGVDKLRMRLGCPPLQLSLKLVINPSIIRSHPCAHGCPSLPRKDSTLSILAEKIVFWLAAARCRASTCW